MYSTNANWNVFIGYKAGQSNVTGGRNIFIGYLSGYSNVSGSKEQLGSAAILVDPTKELEIANAVKKLYENLPWCWEERDRKTRNFLRRFSLFR